MNRLKIQASLVGLVLALILAGACAHTGGSNGPNKIKVPPSQTNGDGDKPAVIIPVPPLPRFQPYPIEPDPGSVSGQPDMKLFWEIWRLAKTEHVDSPISDEKLLLGAIQGMLKFGGDRHSRYVTPEAWKEQQTEDAGSFCGIGATMSMGKEGNGPLTVKEVVKGSPADKAGLKPDDQVLKIDGKPIDGLSLEQAIRLIRGPKGRPVGLQVQRPSLAKPFSITIIRDEIKIVIVEHRMIRRNGRKLAYISLKGFTMAATGDFSKAVAWAKANGAQGVILDLRGNPGGYVSTVRQIAGAWLGQRILFVVKMKMGINHPIPAAPVSKPTESFRHLPTAVLIDGGSASASEILAGALQDYRLATVIGVKSYGKGSMQNLHELSNGGRLALTGNYWTTPNGRILEKNGIVPDIEVKPAAETAGGKRPTVDPQLEKAVETVTRKLIAREILMRDPETRKTLEFLRKSLEKHIKR